MVQIPALLNIKKIVETAKARGFKCHTTGATGYAELYAPDHKGAEGMWYEGCQYSCADVILSDSCNTGYGYNPWFYGPFHKGLLRSDDFGLSKLLEHPAMTGCDLSGHGPE